jgi:methylphosphotriester-DNA--protein-cysteine methyltransferase
VTAFLRRSLRLERLDPLAMAAVRDLLAAGGARRVSEVGGRLGVSARTLERRFRRQVGMGPKLFARLARFQEVLRQGSGRTDLPGLALDAGYYDQPHLLRDFREFVGLAPREYFRPEANEMSRLFIAGDDGP